MPQHPLEPIVPGTVTTSEPTATGKPELFRQLTLYQFRLDPTVSVFANHARKGGRQAVWHIVYGGNGCGKS